MKNSEGSSEKLVVVMTTIQPPTACMKTLEGHLEQIDATLVVVGDKKGPSEYPLANTTFFSIEHQMELDWETASLLPVGHYARKNIGYLEAVQLGASCIYETDDDNEPISSWKPRHRTTAARAIEEDGWVNVYRCFTEKLIWPRGLPLDVIGKSHTTPPKLSTSLKDVAAPIQQGLADNSPDVDAIWRLVLDSSFRFEQAESVYLPAGAWCPFNSQTTWWWPEAYPLLYLPSFCSFRMTDIWRSFIAQRCLWEMGYGLVFHAPEVTQDRNEHNLMRDFEDEIPGYMGNRKIAEVLEGLTLQAGEDATCNNLRKCYEALIQHDFFPEKELDILDAWITDIAKVGSAR